LTSTGSLRGLSRHGVPIADNDVGSVTFGRMPVDALLLALGSAFLHAGWNYWVKTSSDRLIAMWGVVAGGAILFLPLVLIRGIDPVTYPYLMASGVLLTGYVFALATAYDRVDFSLAYPVARGTAPAIAALLSLVFVGETLGTWQTVALGLIVLSLVSMVGRPSGVPGIEFALLTGVIIASYSVIDAAGARRIDDGLTYSAAVYVVNAGFATPLVLLARRERVIAAVRRDWLPMLLAGAASVVAYALVLSAALLAPIGLVAAVRETSVVIGAWLGTVRLKESGRRRRIAAAIGVVAGIALLGFG
jgi:drug/metabolite transporter (DMT)-like permease